MRDRSGARLSVATVLIVDDDQATVDQLVRLIDEAGWLPLWERTVDEARRVIDQEPPALVLLEPVTDEGRGYTLLESLVGDPHAPPFVIVSSSAIARTFGASHTMPILKKPFTAPDLVKAMKAVMKGDAKSLR